MFRRWLPLKHGFHLHIFPPQNSEGQKLTVTGEIFDQAMKKPRGFLQYLKRHPAATIAMDNCPAHNKARATFRDTGISVLPWAAKSPDLNPIEKLWSVMDTDKNLLQPRNRQQLEAAIEGSFLKLKQTHSATVQKTLKSFRKRCEIVISRNGGHCGY